VSDSLAEPRPVTVMSRARAIWIWLIAITIGVALVIFAFSLDPAVHAWQRGHTWKNIVELRRDVTRAADWPSHIFIGLALAGLAYWRGNKKWARVFLAMVAAATLAGTFAFGLKIATGRVRPSVKVERGWGRSGFRQNFQSFPSGHSAVTTGFFAVLFFVRWRTALLWLPVPLFIAFSRVFLAAHFLSDVVAGMVLGAWSALLIAQLMLFPPVAAVYSLRRSASEGG
jgi:membrane-associated phospholipid phosphatase